jgi:TM2 domain-containing membrane protein YozV
MVISPQEKQKIDPGLAAVFSFIFSGLGQIYNGEILKGIWIIALSALGMVLVIIGFIQIAFCLMTDLLRNGDMLIGSILLIAGFLLILILGIYNIYDAYNTAKKRLEG